MADVQLIQTLYGSETQLMEASDERRVYTTLHSDGSGTVEKYEVFPGIQLYNQIFHLTNLDYDRNVQRYSQDIISINHCRLGRFEAEFADGEFLYMGEGDLAMNLPERSPVHHSFPLGNFQGITIIISVEEAAAGLSELSGGFGEIPIDIRLLRDRLQAGNEFVILRSSPRMEQILNEMYREREQGKLFTLKIKVLELLDVLQSSGKIVTERRPYFHKNQVSRIKEMTAFMKQHLDRNFTLEELSSQYDIPLSTMKKCFRAVYGMPIQAYMREYRIHAAADLLRQSDLSVAEIAERVGYANQSKFTEAFKRIMKCTPVAYRNLKS